MTKKIKVKNESVFQSARTKMFVRMCKISNDPWVITVDGINYCLTFDNESYKLSVDGPANPDVIAAMIDVSTGDTLEVDGVVYKFKPKKVFWTNKKKAMLATAVCVVGGIVLTHYANKD